MTNVLEFDGFIGDYEYYDEDRVFWGKLLGTSDSIMYEGETMEELLEDFKLAVEDYAGHCAELGKEPTRPLEGNFHLNLEPELRKRLNMLVTQRKTTVNSVVEEALREYFEKQSLFEEAEDKQEVA